MISRPTPIVVLLALGALLSGCPAAADPEACLTLDDCTGTDECVAGRCIPPRDAGLVDAASVDAALVDANDVDAAPDPGPDAATNDTGPAPTCEEYCEAVTVACEGEYEQYANRDECFAACAGATGWPAGTHGDMNGNTIGCRLYHAGVAAMLPAVHCPHAGPSGGGVCVD